MTPTDWVPWALGATAATIVILTIGTHHGLVLREIRRDVRLIRTLLLVWARLWGAPEAELQAALQAVLHKPSGSPQFSRTDE